MISSAAGGAYWPIAIRCPSLGPFPSIGGGAPRLDGKGGGLTSRVDLLCQLWYFWYFRKESANDANSRNYQLPGIDAECICFAAADHCASQRLIIVGGRSNNKKPVSEISF